MRICTDAIMPLHDFESYQPHSFPLGPFLLIDINKDPHFLLSFTGPFVLIFTQPQSVRIRALLNIFDFRTSITIHNSQLQFTIPRSRS